MRLYTIWAYSNTQPLLASAGKAYQHDTKGQSSTPRAYYRKVSTRTRKWITLDYDRHRYLCLYTSTDIPLLLLLLLYTISVTPGPSRATKRSALTPTTQFQNGAIFHPKTTQPPVSPDVKACCNRTSRHTCHDTLTPREKHVHRNLVIDRRTSDGSVRFGSVKVLGRRCKVKYRVRLMLTAFPEVWRTGILEEKKRRDGCLLSPYTPTSYHGCWCAILSIPINCIGHAPVISVRFLLTGCHLTTFTAEFTWGENVSTCPLTALLLRFDGQLLYC